MLRRSALREDVGNIGAETQLLTQNGAESEKNGDERDMEARKHFERDLAIDSDLRQVAEDYLEKFGEDIQLVKVSEELNEFSAALSKLRIALQIGDEIDYIDARRHVLEEYADLTLMLFQFDLIMSKKWKLKGLLRCIMEHALKRAKERLKEVSE